MPRADGPRDRRRRRSRSRRASRHAAGAQSSASRPPRDPPQDAGSAWLDPVWDQCLRELLVDLPLPVAQALVGLGPQSCEDVRCIWSSSEALMEELADVMHADLNTRTNEQIARLWSFARREGLRQRDETVRTVVVARQSSYLPRRARGSGTGRATPSGSVGSGCGWPTPEPACGCLSRAVCPCQRRPPEAGEAG